MIFLISCGTDPETARLQAAAAASGVASVTYMPELPEDCRVQLDSKLAGNERLDIYALRMKTSVIDQNERITRCAAFHDDIGRRR
jgi:hypothetical protein